MRFGQYYLIGFVTYILLYNVQASGENDTEVLDLKFKKKNKDRSTSSSSAEKSISKESGDKDESLDLSGSTSSSSSEEKKNNEYLGWRQWHRQCTPCPDDMALKWKDHSIRWICGAYQEARRSFKSLCLMHYRNCQDGTMFVKISDHRCKNDTEHGDHFFYDYHVELSDESDSDSSFSESDSSSSSVEFD